MVALKSTTGIMSGKSIMADRQDQVPQKHGSCEEATTATLVVADISTRKLLVTSFGAYESLLWPNLSPFFISSTSSLAVALSLRLPLQHPTPLSLYNFVSKAQPATLLKPNPRNDQN